MSDIWTNKNGGSSTTWSGGSGSSTTWNPDAAEPTQVWSESDGTTSSGTTTGAPSSIGTTTSAGENIGTYSSAATAATSLIGGKYHLFDDKEFHFGTDSDVRISFDTAGAGMLVRVLPPREDDSILMTLRNGDEDIVKFSNAYLTIPEAKADISYYSSAETGSLIFTGEDLYIRV